jgi:hypothetical protein
LVFRKKVKWKKFKGINRKYQEIFALNKILCKALLMRNSLKYVLGKERNMTGNHFSPWYDVVRFILST